MANQCEQLVRLLRDDGASVDLVRNNAPYWPTWVGRLPVVRAACRLLPYLVSIWRAMGRAQVVHLLANSGWAWHLFATPVLLVGRLRGTPVIVNYRGGQADTFFASAPGHVLRLLRGAALRVTPSTFLQRVFRKHGLDAEVVPNIIDLSRFRPAPARSVGDAPHLVVTRNLEPIYDIATAVRTLRRVREQFPLAHLTVAGTGPELVRLKQLARELGLADVVRFPGRINNADMPGLYAAADCVLNPSTADNMPNSVLEAFASGVPVVSTDAGGIADMAEHGRHALLMPVGDDAAMAREVVRLLRDSALRQRLVAAGLDEVPKYTWSEVRERWRAAYWRAARTRGAA